MEMAVVTTAQSKVVAITCSSIKLYPIQKREHHFSLSLPSFLFPSSPSSTKRKVEIGFVGIEISVLVFLFGIPSFLLNLKYQIFPPNPKHTLLYHYLLYKSVFLSIDHQLSELVESIIIVIQYSLFIDAKIIITFILLLWKNAIPSVVVID